MDPTWFERGVHPESVTSALRHQVPEFRSGTVRLSGCRVTRLRSADDGDRWTATYLLAVEGPGGAQRTISAHGALVPVGDAPPTTAGGSGFGDDGWSCWLPDLRLHLHIWSADAQLPGLDAITHEASARPVLEQLLHAYRPASDDVRLLGCQSAVMSYKPGLRGTVCCDLTITPSETAADWPRTVVAKVHRVDHGRACHDVLEALWASPLRSSPAVRIAEPIGYVDELGISVQSYLDHGCTLKELLADSFAARTESAQVHDAIRGAAAGLAALHTSGVSDGETTVWAEELAAVEAKQARLSAVVPWVDRLTGTALKRIGQAGGHVDPDPAAPAHGSFRPAQVLLLDDGGLGLIDFDKAAQAEPAMDIARFFAKVRHTAVNKAADQVAPGSPAFEARSLRVDSLAEVFLAAYREHAPVTEGRVRVWEALELCSLVLSAAKKMLPDRADTCAAMLERHLLSHDATS